VIIQFITKRFRPFIKKIKSQKIIPAVNLKICYSENMQNQTTLTLPKEVREKYGLKEGDQLILEEGEGGLVLRIARTFPIETYSDERVVVFEKENEAALTGFKL
jgi:AbrB family looped-hinge helix DNA binding protein